MLTILFSVGLSTIFRYCFCHHVEQLITGAGVRKTFECVDSLRPNSEHDASASFYGAKELPVDATKCISWLACRWQPSNNIIGSTGPSSFLSLRTGRVYRGHHIWMQVRNVLLLSVSVRMLI